MSRRSPRTRGAALARPGSGLALAAWISLLVASSAGAQPTDPEAARIRVGVALSGGGAKGFAHIGALKVFEEVGVPIDAVAGTSMGSVVGGLYAIGYTPAMLEEIAYSQDWNEIFSRTTPRRLQPVEERKQEERFLLTLPLREGRPGLPAGLIPGQRISMTLARLTLPVHQERDFTRLPVPFACVATDLETGQGVRLDRGFLPRAIRASTAIPTVFSPVQIGEQFFIDGGVARNLPAEDARALGADVVLCVDVSSRLERADSLKTLIDVLQQAVGYRMAESAARQRQLCDVLIEPDVAGFSVFDFDRAAEIVRRGEAAARGMLPRLRALADSVGRVRYPRRTPPPLEDSVYVSRVRVEAGDAGLERQVWAALGFDGPRWFTAGDLEAAVERVYSRQVFGRVTFQLEPDEGREATTLVLQALERDQERLGVGVRYDSHYRAALLIDATVRAVGLRRLGGHVRLGEVVQVAGAFEWPLLPRFGTRFLLRATRGPIDLFEERERVSSVRTEVVEASARASVALTNAAAVSLTAGGELFNLNRTVGVASFLEEARGLLTGTAQLYLDTFDRVAFARQGHRLVARAGFGASLNEPPFTHHVFDWQARWPVTARLSLTSRLSAGQAYGGALPLHYRFYLGGTFEYEYGAFAERHFPLLGFEVQELAGRSMQAVGLGAQVRVGEAVYLQARWNAAHVSDGRRWSLDPDRYRRGVGLTAGARTLVGPVEVTLVGRSERGPFDVQVTVGHAF